MSKDKQIEAMKRWVEVFDGNWHDEPVDSEWADRAHQALAEMRQAIAEAEQPAQQSAERGEPVAKVYRHGKASNGTPWHGVHWFDEGVNMPDGTLLYTAPPAQRKPLTDEQIKEIFLRELGDLAVRIPPGWRKVVNAIESAHGITKGGTQ